MEISVHGIVYALSNTLSNILLHVDAGDIDYDSTVKVTLKDDKLVVRDDKGFTIETSLD